MYNKGADSRKKRWCVWHDIFNTNLKFLKHNFSFSQQIWQVGKAAYSSFWDDYKITLYMKRIKRSNKGKQTYVQIKCSHSNCLSTLQNSFTVKCFISELLGKSSLKMHYLNWLFSKHINIRVFFVCLFYYWKSNTLFYFLAYCQINYVNIMFLKYFFPLW